jgi:hypothetical protein
LLGAKQIAIKHTFFLTFYNIAKLNALHNSFNYPMRICKNSITTFNSTDGTKV